MPTQAERTAATRHKLLDATLAVLVERGYRATSTPVVCRRARVSRGGQLHHFASKQELVAAAVEHLFRRRLDEIAARLARTRGAPDLADVANRLLAVYSGETFHAWLEVCVAARTDAKLRQLVVRLDARFVEGAEALCRTWLLGDGAHAKQVAATTRLVLAIFDGLAMHRILAGRDDPLAKRVLAVAAQAGLFERRRRSRAGNPPARRLAIDRGMDLPPGRAA